MRVVVLALGVLVFLPSVLLADALLAGGTIDFLLSQSEDIAAFAHPIVLKFLALLAILAVELKIAVVIAHLRDERSPFAIALVVCGLVVAAAMTFMTFVVTSAAADNTDGLKGTAAQLPWAAAALTLTLHCLAIYSGDHLRTAVSWLIFAVRYQSNRASHRAYQRQAQRAPQLLGSRYRAHEAAVARHNRDYPQFAVRFGPIEADLITLLRTLFSEDELRRSGAILYEEMTSPQPSAWPTSPPATDTARPSSNMTVPPTNTTTTTSNSIGNMNFTEQSTDTNTAVPPTDTVNAAADYSAMAAEEEVLRAEAEVTA